MKVLSACAALALALLTPGTVIAQKASEGGDAAKTTLSPLVAVDANGKVVGRYMTGRTFPTMVVTTINSALVAIPVTGLTHLNPNAGGGILEFVNTGCTGTAYLREEQGRVEGTQLSQLIESPAGTFTLLVGSPTGVVLSLMQSLMFSNDGFCTDFSYPPGLAVRYPVVSTFDFSAAYVAPFTLQ